MFELAADWQLTAERTNFKDTGRYEEAVEFCRKLDRESDQAKMFTMGKSPQGRDVVVLILSKEKDFSPEAMKKSKKPLVFIENGIHSGEIEGKDASLMMARDILITKTEAKLLDQANIAIVPIFGVDAHERFGPYNRANQNGPTEMGWRTNARNINLNRDFIKADADEMRALLGFLNKWTPDVFFDNHVTDGGDWQYIMTFDIGRWPTMDAEAQKFSERMNDHLLTTMNRDGWVTGPYFGGINYNNPMQGAALDTYSPRYSHGYYALHNRPAILVETHVLKEYKPRVLSTYAIMKLAINYAGTNAAELKRIGRDADERERQLKEGDSLVITTKTKDEWRDWTFKGYEYKPYQSEVTGGQVRAWGTTPVDFPSRIKDQFIPGDSVVLPAAYLVPPQWKEVIALLDLHGLKYERVKMPGVQRREKRKVTVFSNVKFPASPFESRFMPTFEAKEEERMVTIADGSVIVPVNQPGARILVTMMEPAAEDSLVHWGFFNQVFVRTEYAEDYAMEPFAKKMLASDAKLKAEYEEKLKDPVFAGNPGARLNWLFERSPFYDETYSVHPVLRLSQRDVESLRGKSR
jgi:hypothetical protein